MANGRGETPFDPALGAAKLFGEIQAEGLRAAGALVERLVHLVDGPHVAPVTGDSDEERSNGDDSGEAGAIVPWFELWRDLMERTLDALQRLQGATAGPSGEGVQVGIDGSLAPTHPLAVVLEAGGIEQGEMWLHNGTPSDQGELVPQCGPLSDAYGNVLDCDVDINPPKIDGLPSRSSRGFVISVAAGSSAPAGTYRGVVQVRGADAVWMPIKVIVEARTS
jgi:hypothetical protein